MTYQSDRINLDIILKLIGPNMRGLEDYKTILPALYEKARVSNTKDIQTFMHDFIKYQLNQLGLDAWNLTWHK